MTQDKRRPGGFTRRKLMKTAAVSAAATAGGAMLAAPAQAKLVRAGSDGRPVTDGPFTETKEFLAGYWIVQVPSLERACEIAAEASAAPGIGGAPINMPIEVREVLDGAPPIEVSRTGRTFKLVHGAHRFYCAVASGYSKIAAVEVVDVWGGSPTATESD